MNATEMEVKATLKEIAPCEKELHVEVPLEEVAEETERVFRELKKRASVPGFRVGYAPRDLLERHHGQRAREEIMRGLLERSVAEALRSQGELDLVGRPVVTQVNFEPAKPMTYVAKLELAPTVALGPYRGLKLTRPKVQVSEETVAQVLSSLQESHAQLLPVKEDRPAAEGDYLLADLTEEPRGKKAVKRSDLVFSLDLARDPKGILRALVGMKPGEKRTHVLEDGTIVSVELKGIKVKEVPRITDEFAKQVGPFDTLEKLKGAIREDLKRNAQASQRQALEDQAVEQLLSGWRFEVPPSLVGSQARRNLRQRALELINQGVPPEKIQEQARGDLVEKAKLDALKQVELFFILRRIAQEEKLWATDEEAENRLAALAQRFQRPVEEFRKELEQKDLLDDLIWSITRSKVIDLLIQQAEVR